MVGLVVMIHSPLVQQFFLLGTLALIGFLTWQLFLPFFGAIVISSIVVVVSYPAYEYLLSYTPRRSRSLAAFIATLLVLLLIILPLFVISSLLVSEFLAFVNSFESDTTSGTESLVLLVQDLLTRYVPGFEANMTQQIQQSTDWLTRNIGGIFSSTVSFVITLLISILGIFYLFRDGRRFRDWLVVVSPLPDDQDQVVIDRVTTSVRSVATGTVLLSILQGIVATIGFAIFGIEQAILWGAIGAFGALLPGVGLAGVMVPAVAFLFFTGQTTFAIGLLVYAVVAIAIIDNLIGPYLMSRGNKLHPFVIMLSVLGGIAMFGPIGFILGPVVVSLFLALLELYAQSSKNTHGSRIRNKSIS